MVRAVYAITCFFAFTHLAGGVSVPEPADVQQSGASDDEMALLQTKHSVHTHLSQASDGATTRKIEPVSVKMGDLDKCNDRCALHREVAAVLAADLAKKQGPDEDPPSVDPDGKAASLAAKRAKKQGPDDEPPSVDPDGKVASLAAKKQRQPGDDDDDDDDETEIDPDDDGEDESLAAKRAKKTGTAR